MEERSEERENGEEVRREKKKILRLNEAKEKGRNIVIDFEFPHLMTTSELHILFQQVLL